MRARFDDLRPTHRLSFGFDGLIDEIAAHRVEDVLPALQRAERAAQDGYWVAGYVGYEAAPAFDDFAVVGRRPAEGHRFLPLVWFGVFAERVEEPAWPPPGSYALGEWSASVSRAEYDDAIRRIREHIRQGDTYQVNYSMRLRAAFSGDPVAYYRDLCAAQSGGYGAYLDTGRFRVLSASPELFFERIGPKIRTRPMKGTVGRGRFTSEDEERREALVASVKDRAENVMIVDLLRNDLGRVAEFGTVRVDALFEPERYDTLWQLTSTISGSIASHVSTTDVFRALFPCGSITGAPKVRTMEIIAATEAGARGVYCGAIGYLSPSAHGEAPDMAFSVAIRTVVVDMVEGDAEYGTGGGITYDSSAESEYREAMVKAEVLTRSKASFRLLETVRWDPDEGFALLDEHLGRLADSAAYFGISVDLGDVLAAMKRAVGAEAALVVRVLVDRAGGVAVETSRLVERFADPVRLAVDRDPVDSSDPFLFHKTTHRTVYDERRVRHPDVDEVILVNEGGEVTEGTITNLLALIDGEWSTPPISSGCLPGVGRAALIESGQVSERRLTVDDLRRADAIEVVNSVRGRRPATLVW